MRTMGRHQVHHLKNIHVNLTIFFLRTLLLLLLAFLWPTRKENAESSPRN